MRKTSELIALWSSSANASSSEAITAAVGRPAATSSAMFGPERTATGRPVTSVESRLRRSRDRGPSSSDRTGARPGQRARHVGERLRRHARARSGLSLRAVSQGLSPGQCRKGRPSAGSAGCARSPRSRAPAPASRHTSVTSWPRSKSSRENAVPHDPAPTTAILIRAARSRSDRARPRARSARAAGSRSSSRSRASRATDRSRRSGSAAACALVCVPYRRFSRRPARCGGCAPRATRRGSGSARRSRSARCASRTAARSGRAAGRSPRPVFAETAISGGRCRSRASSRGRTSSIPTMPTSHFERTTIVEHIALRATSATARSWSTTPSDTSTRTSATSARSAASSARSSE